MSKKIFLAPLAAMAIVALCVSAAATRADGAVRTYASHGQTSSSSGVKITTDCGISGYMVAVG